jgi:hypothetical protein
LATEDTEGTEESEKPNGIKDHGVGISILLAVPIV